jgi:hypothetical protein
VRDSNTERIGVYVVGLKFTKDLDWIFREQTISDVGIDAFVEEKVLGNPTGKFLALQIKTGKGNFNETNKHFTYYVSNIHYHYWLNSNLPVLLVAHLPDTDLTIWEYISELKLQKTNKQWKINLLKDKILCEQSKSEFSKILSGQIEDVFTQQFNDGIISDEVIDIISNEVNSITEASEVLKEMTGLFLGLGEKTNYMTERITKYAKQGLNEKDKLILKSVKEYSKYLNNFAAKVNTQLDDFAYYFSEGFSAYEKLTIVNYQINKDFEAVQNTHSILTDTLKEMKESINATFEFKNEVSSLPTKYSHLKKSRLNLLDTSNQILKELRIASNLLFNFLNNIEERMN